MPKKLPVEKLGFVQFLNPGGEHRPDDGSLKGWNTGPHKRKFARIACKCVRGGENFEGELDFWTEWEPQSEVVVRIADPLPCGPRYICRPFYRSPHHTGACRTPIHS